MKGLMVRKSLGITNELLGNFRPCRLKSRQKAQTKSCSINSVNQKPRPVYVIVKCLAWDYPSITTCLPHRREL